MMSTSLPTRPDADRRRLGVVALASKASHASFALIGRCVTKLRTPIGGIIGHSGAVLAVRC